MVIQQRFVGRTQQLAELHSHLTDVLAGDGRVCFVTGQAGSGKTALVNRFFQEALERAPEVIVAVGSSNSQTGMGDPYLPFREALAMLTGDVTANQAVGKIAPENANRIRTVMVRSVQVLVEVAPELVNVLIPGGKLLTLVGQAMVKKTGWMERLEQLTKRDASKVGDPPSEQGRIFEQFTNFLQRLSAETPIILFLDDLQWADNASINLLFHMARELEEYPILIVGAYRPPDLALGRDGKRHPLEPVVHELTRYYGDVTVDLDDISETAFRQFIDDLIDDEPNALGDDFRQALFHQTGGHALFTVELIRAMQVRGSIVHNDAGEWVAHAELDWQALPARVEGVIEERIARLDEELREMLTVGSVEGEAFTAEVIARVETLAEREVIQLLSNELQHRHGLLDEQGVVRIGATHLSFYRFIHNLYQQYIYNHLSDAERHYIHRDVGTVLESLFAGQTEVVAAKLAYHFEMAGMAEKAATYRLQAGTKARRMSANAEAITHQQRGLQLLAELPDSTIHTQLELGLQTALGMTMVATRGYASEEVRRAFARARELTRILQDPRQNIPVLYGLSIFYLVSGDLEQAVSEGMQLLLSAEQTGETGYQLGAHLALGAAKMYMGELEEARSHLEQAIVYDETSIHLELACLQGQDPTVASLSFLALVLWLQGYPEKALATKDAAFALVAKFNHPHSTAYAYSIAKTLFRMLRMEDEFERYNKAALQASQGRFPLWHSAGEMSHGWTQVVRGETEAGITAIEQGMTRWKQTGAQLHTPYFQSALAEAHLLVGNRAAGLSVIDEAIHQPLQAWWLAEEYRLQAELLLLTPSSELEAENCLHKGLQIARAQKAKSLELRLCMSLARLLHKQGRTAEGHDLLADCYGWFSEGFATTDLVTARTLLAELAQSMTTANDRDRAKFTTHAIATNNSPTAANTAVIVA